MLSEDQNRRPDGLLISEDLGSIARTVTRSSSIKVMPSPNFNAIIEEITSREGF